MRVKNHLNLKEEDGEDDENSLYRSMQHRKDTESDKIPDVVSNNGEKFLHDEDLLRDDISVPTEQNFDNYQMHEKESAMTDRTSKPLNTDDIKEELVQEIMDVDEEEEKEVYLTKAVSTENQVLRERHLTRIVEDEEDELDVGSSPLKKATVVQPESGGNKMMQSYISGGSSVYSGTNIMKLGSDAGRSMMNRSGLMIATSSNDSASMADIDFDDAPQDFSDCSDEDITVTKLEDDEGMRRRRARRSQQIKTAKSGRTGMFALSLDQVTESEELKK